MSILSPVLVVGDLPAAELQAARLDGELYGLGGAFCQVGELEGPTHRALAVLGGRSRRLIAELRTAAWVWSAAEEPTQLEFAVTPEARARLSPAEHITVREIVYEPSDVVDLGGVRVTSPVRTAVDLARFADPFEPATVARLGAVGHISLAECLNLLDTRSGIPAKDRARLRLAAAFGR